MKKFVKKLREAAEQTSELVESSLQKAELVERLKTIVEKSAFQIETEYVPEELPEEVLEELTEKSKAQECEDQEFENDLTIESSPFKNDPELDASPLHFEPEEQIDVAFDPDLEFTVETAIENETNKKSETKPQMSEQLTELNPQPSPSADSEDTFSTNTPATGDLSKLEQDLRRLVRRLDCSEKFSVLHPQLQTSIRQLLGAEHVDIYLRGRGERVATLYPILSHSEDHENDHHCAIETGVSIGTSSLVGFAALTQRSLRLDDISDRDALKSINENLSVSANLKKILGFTPHSMLIAPILHRGVVLGVLEAINSNNSDPFTETRTYFAEQLANALGEKLHGDFRGTNDPFDYLIQSKKVSSDVVANAKIRAKRENRSVAEILIQEANLTSADIGASFERYYQVPFMEYDPAIQIPSEILQGLNIEYLRKQRWVPIAGDLNELTILIDDPTDTSRLREIEQTLPADQINFRIGIVRGHF